MKTLTNKRKTEIAKEVLATSNAGGAFESAQFKHLRSDVIQMMLEAMDKALAEASAQPPEAA